MSKSFYLTTTLPYVNDKPHMGHALEFVQADIIARYRKLTGDDVFFNTGTDEHGLKIFRKAQEEGKDAQAYTDEFAAKFRALPAKLGMDPDIHFIRTTDPKHKKAAQEFWKRCEKDIYKKKYKGLYCVGDEAFVKETDLVDGMCPNHPGQKPIEIEEENYFFALSRYQEKLEKYLSQEGVIVPEWRRLEALNFVKSGLEDFFHLAAKKRLPWGITVPNDDSQVMYVWFDALINYISTLGWPDESGDFKKFWTDGETLQLAGKDQVRFQSVMWQAMLMSAGLKTTDKVLYHGFITSDGKKMSKSVGNVVDPIAIVEEYGADALRYFLARHISPFEDSDFTMEKFKEAYNADLANGLGNLTRRILTLAQSYNIKLGKFDRNSFKEIVGGTDLLFKAFGEHLNNYRFDFALDRIWNEDVSGAMRWMNALINQERPFETLKTNFEKGKNTLLILLEDLWDIATLLEPIMPTASSAIKSAMEGKSEIPLLFPRKE